jgi:hypothetical protein
MLTGKLVSLCVISHCAVFLFFWGGGGMHGECNCHVNQGVSVCLEWWSLVWCEISPKFDIRRTVHCDKFL